MLSGVGVEKLFLREIARKLICKWLIVRSRNGRELHEITVLVPFSTPTGHSAHREVATG
jgi:hypothetical protein